MEGTDRGSGRYEPKREKGTDRWSFDETSIREATGPGKPVDPDGRAEGGRMNRRWRGYRSRREKRLRPATVSWVRSIKNPPVVAGPSNSGSRYHHPELGGRRHPIPPTDAIGRGPSNRRLSRSPTVVPVGVDRIALTPWIARAPAVSSPVRRRGFGGKNAPRRGCGRRRRTGF